MFRLIIQNKGTYKTMPFDTWVEASNCRDACRETLRVALQGNVSEVYDRNRNAFIIKGEGVFVELIINN